nr:MAG TPA: hypothetical protein [Bacteriophage sp.]
MCTIIGSISFDSCVYCTNILSVVRVQRTCVSVCVRVWRTNLGKCPCGADMR